MEIFSVKKLICLLLCFILACPSSFAFDESKTIRVGISTSDFSNWFLSETNIYSSSYLETDEPAEGNVIASNIPSANIKLKNSVFEITTSDGCVYKSSAKEIRFTSLGKIGITGLKRNGKPAVYRGEIRFVKNSDGTKFATVNVLNLKDYLRGVVPNEMPVSFGLEALKAQCVAARNYALRPRVTYYKEFDICDSVACQVYFGANTEKPLSDKAVEETDGIVALYDGELILALYSSTAGGYTEDYTSAFTVKPTDPRHPYLKAKPDKGRISALNSEGAARSFYLSRPDSFENASPFYRWTKTWSYDELVRVLNKTLLEQSGFTVPRFTKNDKFSQIKEIKILERGNSGKVISIEIITDKGSFIAGKELVIRRLFKKDGKALPSANFVTDLIFDPNTNKNTIKFSGGGFGHGVGMSQFGAGGMAAEGKTFDEILHHYYSGVSLGTMPVILDDTHNDFMQIFYFGKGKAKVVTDSLKGTNELILTVNGRRVDKEFGFFGKKHHIDISNYLINGSNVIEYKLPENHYTNTKMTVRTEMVPRE